MNDPVASPRLVSLDAFRGATIAGMLLVNNPGDWGNVYPPLLHAPWHGWTFTDTIFPSFLWIVGVAMTLSFARRMEQGADRAALFRHALIRSALIFLIGILLAAFPFGLLPTHELSLGRLRIPGVLQRIALCSAAAAAIFLTTRWRGQVAWVLALLAGYAALLFLVPVPGYGAGVIDRAEGSVPWWIDSTLLAGHTWSGAPAKGFDPEGILSTLPAIATTLLGVLAGQVLRHAPDSRTTVLRLLILGASLLAAGIVVSPWLPLNKNLWTSSYTLFMAGWSTLFFAACYWAIDVRGWRGWAQPFVMYGMNALALFVLAGAVARLLSLIRWTDDETAKVVTLKAWIYRGFQAIASPINASLLYAVAFVLVFLGIAWALWRKRWFIKV